MNTTELKNLSDTDFAGYDKDGLMEICLVIGLEPHKNSGSERLKEILREELAKRSGKKKLDQELIKGLQGFPWRGLKKLVHLRRDATTGKAKKHPVSWNGHNVNIPYDRPNVSIPWPHYLIMKTAELGRFNISDKDDGSMPDMTEEGYAKFNIDDMGDDPKSFSKWKSLAEYFLSEWPTIENMSAKAKATILSQLTDGEITRSYIEAKKWDDEDVTNHLKALLGVPEDDEDE